MAWPVWAFLVALGLSVPCALLVWDRRRGVHVVKNGIRTASANAYRFIGWREIDRFEIDAYMAGTIAVFAVRLDGTRVPLGDTARWPYQRPGVERVRNELARYRDCLAPTDRPRR